MKQYLLIILLFVCEIAISQTDSTFKIKKNSLYAEASGSAIFFSLNYERFFYQRNNLKLSCSVGIDPAISLLLSTLHYGLGINGIHKPATFFICPIEGHVFIGKKKHFLEFGIGHTFIFATNNAGRLIQNYIDYDAINSSNNIHYSTKPTETVYYHNQMYNLRVGYRHQNPDMLSFWKISWVPQMFYKSGYKMEPYDKAFRTNTSIWADGPEPEPSPTNYYNPVHSISIEYKAEFFLLNFGLAYGFCF